ASSAPDEKRRNRRGRQRKSAVSLGVRFPCQSSRHVAACRQRPTQQRRPYRRCRNLVQFITFYGSSPMNSRRSCAVRPSERDRRCCSGQKTTPRGPFPCKSSDFLQPFITHA